MKNYLKEIIPAIILALVFSFMLFLYEPITTYASNTEDFWFDFNILLKANLVYVIIFIIFIILFSSIVYIIGKWSKKDIIYTIYILLVTTAFVSTYIQGNFLSGNLPTLDGSPIDWGMYTKQNIISIILIILTIIVNIFMVIKYKEKYKKITIYTALIIFAMLSTSLVSTMLTNNQIYEKKGVYTATNININKLSTNNNFLILLVDMEDSKIFDKVLKDSNKEEIFKDFTYFPDTLSAYPFTRESIPYILSGIWFEEETTFSEYFNNALSNSKFIQNLKDNNYDVNIYEKQLLWTDEKALEINNIKAVNSELDKVKFLKQESKYILFKYLPYYLKKYSKIETLNYDICRNEEKSTYEVFSDDNKAIYDKLTEVSLQKDNYFQFIHADGGHYPWNMNKNFEIIENGTYEEKIESSITLIEKYINRIKESGQYDNSIIIILADHGNNGYDPIGRQNPILYIKGINETHEKMQVSNKKVSYVDLNDCIYYNLLNGKKSTELLENIDDNRVRRFIWYKDYDDMYEQTLDGHAWETDKLNNTGKRYKR